MLAAGMAIPLRSPDEINDIAQAAALFWRAVTGVAGEVRAGMSASEIEQVVAARLGGIGAGLILRGYTQGRTPPFPAAACVSVNEEVVHAVPGGRTLHAGDIVTVDTAATITGERGQWCLDAATTVVVGEAGAQAGLSGVGGSRAGMLAGAARAVLTSAIDAAQPGRTWADVAEAARRAATSAGVRLLGGYSGHGIGRRLHEPPRLDLGPNPSPADAELVLRPGMVFTIEPIVIEGGSGAAGVSVAEDGWTVRTTDGAWAAHEERMVAVERWGSRVLTA